MRFDRVLFAFVCAFLLSPVFAQAQQAPLEVKPAVAVEESAPVQNAEASSHHEEEGGSMPQLDPTYYPSQLFWLLITGVALYMVMSRVALPKVAGMVGLRDTQVRGDLEQAYQLKQQAEDLKIAYTRALRDADEKAKTLIDKTTRKLREKQSDGLADAVERINHKIAEAEQYLRGEKDALVNEAPIISENLAKVVAKELAKGHA